MNVRNVLWHVFPGFGTDQLADGKKIVAVCAELINSEFHKLTQRSNMIAIPSDGRFVTHVNGQPLTYPQEWHFNWMAWTRAFLVTPAGGGPTRLGIGVYIPATKELRICSAMRRVNDGPFVMRLTNQAKQVFILAERQTGLRSGKIYGGMGESAEPIPENIDLF
jgi:hypothetical protein